MIEFTDLKQLINIACTTEQSENMNDKFKFSINFGKLEKLLNQKGTNLHVISGGEVKTSYIPDISELQGISEYIKSINEANSIFNGNAQIMEFILYNDKNGSMKIMNKDSNSDICNIMMNLPVYRTLIIRKFNTKKDKFEYLIYFRSNYNMIMYIKDLKENK